MFNFLSNKKNATLATGILCLIVALIKCSKLYTNYGTNTSWQIISTILFGALAIVNFVKYINFKPENE